MTRRDRTVVVSLISKHFGKKTSAEIEKLTAFADDVVLAAQHERRDGQKQECADGKK